MKLKVGGVSFEWDTHKNSINLKKHGVDFSEAAMVILDENRVEFYDAKHSDEEDRFIMIGMAKDILYVVYAERRKSLRIISARAATASEREYYYGKNS